jgi:hypothetical protein
MLCSLGAKITTGRRQCSSRSLPRRARGGLPHDLPLHRSRALSRNEKLAEGTKLSRAYRREVKERRDELRAHYSELLREIDERFRAASMGTLPALTEWLLTKLDLIEVAPNYRPVLFNYLCARLAALREHAGLSTFDDPLENEPDDLFIRIRRLLVGTEVHTPLGTGRLRGPTSSKQTKDYDDE